MFLPNKPTRKEMPFKTGGRVVGLKNLSVPSQSHLSQNMDGTSTVFVPKNDVQNPLVSRQGSIVQTKAKPKTKSKAKKPKKK